MPVEYPKALDARVGFLLARAHLIARAEADRALAGQVAGAVPDPAQLVLREQGQVSVPLGCEQLLGPLTRRCCIGRRAGPRR